MWRGIKRDLCLERKKRRVVKEERNSLRFGKDEVVGCGGEERKSWVWKDEYTCCGGDEVF